jgi:hypothetical protein
LRDKYFKARFAELATYYRSKDATLTDDGVRDAFFKDVPLGYLEHRAAWSPKGEVGKWVSSHDAMRVVGDTLFLHGGVSAVYAPFTTDEINQRVRAALKGTGDEQILEDQNGPLWFRGLAEETPQGEAEVAAALTKYNVKRIVIGHTPSLTGIKALYGGRVIDIDTGISAPFNGSRSFLKIEGDNVTAYNNGAPTALSAGVQ